jgi:hypothetical protein
VEYTGHAYRFLWDERRYLARLAAVPLAIKLACYLAIEIYGYENALIRHALLMLPSYFLDGWMLSHIVRFALFGQRWPFRMTPQHDVRTAQDRAQGLLTGTAAYVVARFLSMGVVALMVGLMSFVAPDHPSAAAGPATLKTQAFLAVLLVAGASIWGFRLFWLFIPAAANVSMTGVLRRIRGYAISFYMIGTWLIVALPMLLGCFLAASLLALLLGVSRVGAGSPEVDAIMLVGSAFADTFILIATTFALTLGLRPFLADVANRRHGL